MVVFEKQDRRQQTNPVIDKMKTLVALQGQTFRNQTLMTKAYWITSYLEIKDPARLGAYAKLAAPALEAQGGRILARGIAAQAFEAGRLERTVVIEFASVQQAHAAYESRAYQVALAALGDGAVRDLRIVEGV
jgi:uncharacterized protein (DUF1330 family)